MTRSMACELGSHRIRRVNSISPGIIKRRSVPITSLYRSTSSSMCLSTMIRCPPREIAWRRFWTIPCMRKGTRGANPLGRIGRSDELRGALAWLAGRRELVLHRLATLS
ncbi:hypothetical protein LXA43DRAFT_1041524 [Ganoderma leucocontextum]|nr:hypothetical protein LXA43DRAFT_1041524 [Ganoderma leucocontextum]